MKKYLSISLLILCFFVEMLAFNLPDHLSLKEQIDLFCLYTSFGFFTFSYSVLLYINENKTEKYHLTYKLLIQYLVLSSINSLIDELGIAGCVPTIYQASEFIVFVILTTLYVKKITDLWRKMK